MTTSQDSPLRTLFPRAAAGELARDIQSAAISDGTIEDADLWTRPGILRRIASHVADLLPAGVDRVIGDEEDVALLTAVSLHSGVPFAVVDRDSVVQGELHPTETAFAVRMWPRPDGPRSVQAARQRNARVSTLLTVIGTVPPARPADDLEPLCLFQLRDGHIRPGSKS